MLAQGSEPFDPVVGVLMTPRPITIKPFESVAAAATIMRTCRVRHLPVVSPTLVGMLSIRDVIAADEHAQVGDMMTAPPRSIGPSTLVTNACEQMLAGHFSCLPVVEDGQLAGIFTATDALRFANVALEAESRAHQRPEVAQLMTSRPLSTVEPTTSLESAWQLMRAAHVRHLPVVVRDAIVGILSDRDVLAAGRDWLRDGSGSPAILVADAMSTRVSTIRADRPASEAAATLLRRRVGALPVLRGRELRGIITVADFMYWILARA